MNEEAGKENHQVKGYLLALTAAICWGLSGTFGQYLFQHREINTEWLVTMRLLIAGVLLLCIVPRREHKNIRRIWTVKEDARALIVFGIFGMLAVQYTYFAAIEYSNAATATILQYLGPVFIACYIALKNKQLPSWEDSLAILLALAGTFLLVTHGSFKSLAISGWALFWGIASAISLAFYTLQPLRLLQQWDARIVIGWGMLIGGIAFSFVHAPWNVSGTWDLATVSFFSFIILFGSLIAFYAYLVSVKYIGGVKASLLAFAEPLSAALLSILWLQTAFGMLDWTGAGLILLTIVLLTRSKNKSPAILA